MEREEFLEALEGFKQNVLDEVRAIVPKQEEKQEEVKETKSSDSGVPPMPELKGKDAELVNQIVLALEARNKNSAEQVYSTMFNERVNIITSQYPGFGEYLQSKDDFGDVILDRINKIGDYNERVQTLERLFKNYAQAQPSNAEDMRLTKEVREQVRKDEEQREEIKRKFLKGELNHSEFTDQFFGSLESQIERIKARAGRRNG